MTQPDFSSAEVIETLRSHQAELRRRGVRHTALSGSLAHGEARSDSDILIELDLGKPISLFDYVGLKLYIADLYRSWRALAARAMFTDLSTRVWRLRPFRFLPAS